MWLCTSCYACTVQCPRKIPVTEILYALKRRAIEAGTYPKKMPTPVMAQVFQSQVSSRGRMSEVWLVLRLYLKTGIGRLFGFAGTGISLLRTGRVSLKREHIERRAELAGLLAAVDHDKEGVAA
jgi:heterodisulfide reductase subunit C